MFIFSVPIYYFKNFMRAFLLTKPIFIATEMIKFINNEKNDKLKEQKYNVRFHFFMQVAATHSNEVTKC